jgi:hypothetical protein
VHDVRYLLDGPGTVHSRLGGYRGAHLGREALGGRRVDRSGRDRVDPDVLARQSTTFVETASPPPSGSAHTLFRLRELVLGAASQSRSIRDPKALAGCRREGKSRGQLERTSSRISSSAMAPASSVRSRIVPVLVRKSGCLAVKPPSSRSFHP